MSAPPVRLPLAGGAWIRFRRVPGASGKVVITSPDARFLLLGAADFEALEEGAGDPTNASRRKLDHLGFVHRWAPRAREADALEPSASILDPAETEDAGWDALVDRGAPLTIDFGEPPHTAAARAVREIHARYAARGVDPVMAYLNAVVTVGRAAVEAGPDATLAAASEAGLVYIELRPLRGSSDSPPSTDYLAYQRRAWSRVLDVNLSGTLLVEKRLALHLETLIAAGSAAAPPSDNASACAACAYDPYCGSSLLRRWLTEEASSKAWDTPFCEASMGTFDEVFARLASPDGTALRRVFARWTAARDRVARGVPEADRGKA